MALMGVVPLNRTITMPDSGRTYVLDAHHLDDWARGDFEIPMTWRHDLNRGSGWITRAKLTRDHLFLHGEWDDGFDPFAGTCRSLIKTRAVTGLSITMLKYQGERYNPHRHRYEPGELIGIHEACLTPTPFIPSARWLTA